jgi:hypothetical protein
MRATINSLQLGSGSGARHRSPRKRSYQRSPVPGRSSRSPLPYPRTRSSQQKRARLRSPQHSKTNKETRFPKRNKASLSHKSSTAQSDESFFHDSTAPHGSGVCTICLGCHKHNFSRCRSAKLWDGSKSEAWRSEQGCLVNHEGLAICFDWQLFQGCQSMSHVENHRCSGCGKADHGAQSCPRREKN